MALTFPYPAAYLADTLLYRNFDGPHLQRFDEQSGSGDGRLWNTELAPPLWRASASLAPVPWRTGHAINGKIAALDGANKTFLLPVPEYDGPAWGATGLDSVTVGSIRADRGAISLAGTPTGFRVTVGDFFCVQHSSGRVYFGQFEEAGTPGTLREIRPYLSLGVAVGAAVQLVRPYFKAMVQNYTKYNMQPGEHSFGAQFEVLQKP